MLRRDPWRFSSGTGLSAVAVDGNTEMLIGQHSRVPFDVGDEISRRQSICRQRHPLGQRLQLGADPLDLEQRSRGIVQWQRVPNRETDNVTGAHGQVRRPTAQTVTTDAAPHNFLARRLPCLTQNRRGAVSALALGTGTVPRCTLRLSLALSSGLEHPWRLATVMTMLPAVAGSHPVGDLAHPLGNPTFGQLLDRSLAGEAEDDRQEQTEVVFDFLLYLVRVIGGHGPRHLPREAELFATNRDDGFEDLRP